MNAPPTSVKPAAISKYPHDVITLQRLRSRSRSPAPERGLRACGGLADAQKRLRKGKVQRRGVPRGSDLTVRRNFDTLDVPFHTPRGSFAVMHARPLLTRVLRARALCPSKMDARPVRVWNLSAPTTWTQAVVEQRAQRLTAPSGEEAARKLVRRATTGVGPSDGAAIPLGAALAELRVSVRAVAKKRMQAYANEIYFSVMETRLSNPAYPRYANLHCNIARTVTGRHNHPIRWTHVHHPTRECRHMPHPIGSVRTRAQHEGLRHEWQ